MEKTVWNAYNKFRCIADKCPDSCCQGWEVDVDEETAAYYRSLEGDLGDRLRRVLQTVEGESSMILEDGRCPMWQPDGLCRLHAELGHDALCQVCREFPRLYLDYGNYVEWGLEMSCPEAARLIFEDFSMSHGAQPEQITPECDEQTLKILQMSRDELLVLWDMTEWTVPQKLAITLFYAHQVQGAVDGGEYVSLRPRNCLEEAGRYAAEPDVQALLSFFRSLEILTETWSNRLQTPLGGCWDPKLQTLGVYLIRRYWLQAVWDFDIVCRAKLVVAACILVNALGGDPVETSQLFSKEIENDPDNREAILDGAYSQPALTDANLLGLLLKNTP